MVINPTKLFLYALAFRFSPTACQCFSPGLKALFYWYSLNGYARLVDRFALKRWRAKWLEKV